MNLFKFNRILHRDLGYLFFGMTIIYALSGIALNHIKDWNPNYIVESETTYSDLTAEIGITDERVMAFLESINEKENFKKYYYPNQNTLKIFFQNGSAVINLSNGETQIEKLRRRPIFHQFNYLHYNHSKKLWTWFSDAYVVGLLILAVGGLFMVKGKKGITGRGAWLTTLGIVIPLILYLLYV
ncbi:MAG: hypothetical protein CVU09_10600 [Bacteroidetes bacterium HGW-Bacteroidetes-4]|jgi:hypothetical protein|nr:MAG: hypothetical protein CVU09_10600 [Bacteroidetes bacterium HGW-Bacteroidetes-4]